MMSVDVKNRAVFGRRDVVRFYASQEALQGAEAAFLASMKPQLPKLRMLDVGIGGGRTTAHFAPLAREYVGIDYAPEMVEAARLRFADAGFVLDVADARSLPYPEARFDMVLFSHCGIDYVSHEERLSVIREIRRVLSPKGAFCFSTHNLQRARSLLHGTSSETLISRMANSLRRRRLRKLNEPIEQLGERPHAMVNDGAFRFGAVTYHIRPAAQVEQLRACGFDDVTVSSARTGEPLSRSECAATDEPWLSYRCVAA